MHGFGFPFARRYSRVVTLLVLLALSVGQTMAVAHAARHAGTDPGRALPGTHAQLCTDCASLAPLFSVAGGTACPLFVPAQCAVVALRCEPEAHPEKAFRFAFRSRAPPR
jgi:hypothetical protein